MQPPLLVWFRRPPTLPAAHANAEEHPHRSQRARSGRRQALQDRRRRRVRPVSPILARGVQNRLPFGSSHLAHRPSRSRHISKIDWSHRTTMASPIGHLIHPDPSGSLPAPPPPPPPPTHSTSGLSQAPLVRPDSVPVSISTPLPVTGSNAGTGTSTDADPTLRLRLGALSSSSAPLPPQQQPLRGHANTQSLYQCADCLRKKKKPPCYFVYATQYIAPLANANQVDTPVPNTCRYACH